jgi:hypothetical protein
MNAVSTVEKIERTSNNMLKQLVTDNFDINVFDRAQYNNPGGPDHEWLLCPYRLEWDGDNYSISDEMESLNLVLTEDEAKSLTLGWGPDLGGDYHDADDFWIDANSFKDTYKDIPVQVRNWIDFVTYNL